MQIYWCLFFRDHLHPEFFIVICGKLHLQDSSRTELNVFECNEICWKKVFSLGTKNLIQMPFKNQWKFDFNMLLVRPHGVACLKLGASEIPLKDGTLFRKWTTADILGSNFY